MEARVLTKIIKQSKLDDQTKSDFLSHIKKGGASYKVVHDILSVIEKKEELIKKKLAASNKPLFKQDKIPDKETLRVQEIEKIIKEKAAKLEEEYQQKNKKLEAELDKTYQEAVNMTEEDRQQIIRDQLLKPKE